MSLTTIDNRIESDRAKAQALILEAQLSFDRVRADNTLAPVGKTQRIARIFIDTKPKVDALKSDEIKAVADAEASLRRALFGTDVSDPSNLIAMRDAQDRAGRLDNPRDAAALMDRSLMNQDVTLQAAVLEQAIGNNWWEVITAYTTARPDQGERLSDYIGLSKIHNAQAVFMQAAMYRFPVPDELAMASGDLYDELVKIGTWTQGLGAQ